MTAISITNEAWRNIMSFLKPKDYYNLSLVSKRLNAKARESQDAFVKQFHYVIFENQDIFLGNMYQSSAYLSLLRVQLNKNVQSFSLYKTYELSKRQLKEVLMSFMRLEMSAELMENITDALQKPYLRALSLRRESEILETFSLFQYHLNDVMMKSDPESQNSNLFEDDETSEFTLSERKSLRAVPEEDKEIVKAARWYIKTDKYSILDQNEKNSDFIGNTSSKINDLNGEFTNLDSENGRLRTSPIRRLPLLMRLYFGLDEMVTAYCRVMSDYLAAIDDPFLFVTEYTTKWKNFTMSMQTIGTILREFSVAMNEVYNQEFKELPRFPEFSIWRMMTKIWYAEVFSALQKKMIPNFEIIFESYLENFATVLQKTNSSDLYCYIEGIPKELLGAPEFEICTIISEFWQSVVDMSFNESTIHTLTFADMSKINPISSFMSSINKLVLRRCNAVVEVAQLKSSLKFELIAEYMELIESAIPHKLFPEIRQILLNSQKDVMIDFISNLKEEATENISRFLTEDNNKSLRDLIYSEVVDCRYPSLIKHIGSFRSKLQELEEVKRRREAQRLKLQDHTFECAPQQLLMEFGNEIDLKALENLSNNVNLQ